jgi:hypothetical protein
MGNRFSTFVGHRPRTALLGIAVVVGLMLDLVVVSPAIVAFGLAVTIAVAWCVWLDAQSVR